METRTAIICGVTESYVKSFILRIVDPITQIQDNIDLNHGEYHEIKIDRFGKTTESEAPDFSLHLMKMCDTNCKLDKLDLLHPRVLVFILTPNIIPCDQKTKSFENPAKDEDLVYQRNFYEKLILGNQDFFKKYAETIINVIPYKMDECNASEQFEFLDQVRKFQNEVARSMSKENANRDVRLLVTNHFDSIQNTIKLQLVQK